MKNSQTKQSHRTNCEIRCRLDMDKICPKIVELCPDAILLLDENGFIKFLNPSAERLFNRSAEQMIDSIFGFPIEGSKPLELEIIRSEGMPRVAEMITAEFMIDCKPFHIITLRDITDHVRLRKELRYASLYDELTDLFNRRGFLLSVKNCLELSIRKNWNMLLFYLDCDHLKKINDDLGHEHGDRALVEIAEILREVFRESDIIARIGGDEFVALAIDTYEDSAQLLMNRLKKCLLSCNKKKNRQFVLSFSIGVVNYDCHNPCTIENMLANADKMMYAEKCKKRMTRKDNTTE